MLKLICNLIIVIWHSDLIYQIWCLQIYGDKPLTGMRKFYKLFSLPQANLAIAGNIIQVEQSYSLSLKFRILINAFHSLFDMTSIILHTFRKSGAIISYHMNKKSRKTNLQYLRKMKHIFTERRGQQAMHLYFLIYW